MDQVDIVAAVAALVGVILLAVAAGMILGTPASLAVLGVACLWLAWAKERSS